MKSESELLPCPFCGESYCSIKFAGSRMKLFQVYCRDVDCGVRGPERPSEQHAIAAWNTRAPSWISVSEKLPEKKGRYWTHNRLTKLSMELHFSSIEKRFMDLHGRTFTPTHWQPLPPPPVERKEG